MKHLLLPQKLGKLYFPVCSMKTPLRKILKGEEENSEQIFREFGPSLVCKKNHLNFLTISLALVVLILAGLLLSSSAKNQPKFEHVAFSFLVLLQKKWTVWTFSFRELPDQQWSFSAFAG